MRIDKQSFKPFSVILVKSNKSASLSTSQHSTSHHSARVLYFNGDYCFLHTLYLFAACLSFVPVIICDLVGLEKLASGFGLVGLVRGITAIVAPPIAGM